MKTHATGCFLAIFLVTLFSSCKEPETEENRGNRDGTVSGTGTVVLVELEGGFYGIVTESGERYDPINLPEEFREDSIPVYFEGIPKEEVVTFRQWGTPLELATIRRDSAQ